MEDLDPETIVSMPRAAATHVADNSGAREMVPLIGSGASTPHMTSLKQLVPFADMFAGSVAPSTSLINTGLNRFFPFQSSVGVPSAFAPPSKHNRYLFI